jgi:predicted GNAT superfamily acetyltransferase
MATDLAALTVDDLSRSKELETALLALNNAHAAELSWLEPERFAHLLSQAFMARRIGEADALLLTFDQDADYDSPNFRWFQARKPRFVYVDRIVVAPHARGRGLARRLYEDLFEAAREAGHHVVVCEVNSDPPNPGSDAFHAELCFRQVGTASLNNGKTVSYLARALSHDASPAT